MCEKHFLFDERVNRVNRLCAKYVNFGNITMLVMCNSCKFWKHVSLVMNKACNF